MVNKIKINLKNIDFYFITDRQISGKKFFKHIKEALKAGVKIVQYREKELPTKEKINTAKKIKQLTKNKAILIINNDVDVALAVGADGVHLGQEDMPYKTARKLLGKKKIIGLTVHNLKQAKLAEKLGADYIALSPVFKTKTKPDAGKPSGLKFIKDIKKNIKIPFVAIGGINEHNLKEVLKAGGKCVVMISAILTKKDVYREISNIRQIINSH